MVHAWVVHRVNYFNLYSTAINVAKSSGIWVFQQNLVACESKTYVMTEVSWGCLMRGHSVLRMPIFDSFVLTEFGFLFRRFLSCACGDVQWMCFVTKIHEYDEKTYKNVKKITVRFISDAITGPWDRTGWPYTVVGSGTGALGAICFISGPIFSKTRA